jgi:hypothetical protein
MKVTLGREKVWPMLEVRVPEFIVAAACKGPNLENPHGNEDSMRELIFTLPRPWRHPHILHHPQCPEHPEQGFLTSNGRFVDRKEAFRIAAACDQLLKPEEKYVGGDLFTEDLW